LAVGILSVGAKAISGTMGDPIDMFGGAVFCGFAFAGIAIVRNRINGVK
jgi:hypothetical protein